VDQTDPDQSPPVSAVPAPAAPTGAAELQAVTQEVKRIIVGQDRVVERLLVGLLARGHLLLEGVPGLAKTLAMETLATAVGGTFARIQFTPDLLPADITGTRVWRQSAETFDVELGPVFVNFLLADEINRAPAKVQSALLEVMAEHQVSIGGETHEVPEPFLVMATQNPVELEGTFPLPEAQLDRFMVRLKLGYPTPEEESSIYLRFEKDTVVDAVEAVTDGEALGQAQQLPPTVRVDEPVRKYIVDVVGATREHSGISLGASPRAGLALYKTTQAWAAIDGRDFVTPDDVKAMAPSVLPHRMILSSAARLKESSGEQLVAEILSSVSVPIER